MADCEENRVTHIFEALDDVLEFIVMFESGYPKSISARISEGSRSNNDVCVGLSCFVGSCRISV